MAENLVNVQNADGTKVGTGTTVTSGSITATPFVAPSANSNSAPVTSPGAVATIAVVASGVLPAGFYEVYVTTNVGGTVAAADQANMTLSNSVTTTRLANGTGTAGTNFGPMYYSLNGAQALTVATVGAGTAGSIYAATIMATRTA